jgi:hypothetical protein
MWQDQAPHGSGVIAMPISCLLGMVGPWLRGLARFTSVVSLCVCAHLHTIINTFESKCLGLAVRMSELPRNFTPTHLGFWGSSLTDSSHKQTNTRHSLIFFGMVHTSATLQVGQGTARPAISTPNGTNTASSVEKSRWWLGQLRQSLRLSVSASSARCLARTYSGPLPIDVVKYYHKIHV